MLYNLVYRHTNMKILEQNASSVCMIIALLETLIATLASDKERRVAGFYLMEIVGCRISHERIDKFGYFDSTKFYHRKHRCRVYLSGTLKRVPTSTRGPPIPVKADRRLRALSTYS